MFSYTYIWKFFTNFYLAKLGLRCKLQEKVHRVTRSYAQSTRLSSTPRLKKIPIFCTTGTYNCIVYVHDHIFFVLLSFYWPGSGNQFTDRDWTFLLLTELVMPFTVRVLQMWQRLVISCDLRAIQTSYTFTHFKELLKQSIFVRLGCQHPLYIHGVCQWPGCDTFCESFQLFMQ